jgi:cytochrome b
MRTRGTPTWDLPVRIFHWLLVLLVISQLVSASIGGNAMQFHAYGGYAILALVMFRILWGLLGGTHARFVDFVRAPATAIHDVNAAVLLTLIAVHIAAVVFYLLARRENLIVPMITGRKQSPMSEKPARYGNVWLAALLLGCSAAAVYLVIRI